jgi:hypothetical protein
MLKALAFRLGFVLCLSLAIRAVGLLSPHQLKPPAQLVGVSGPAGAGQLPPADLGSGRMGIASDKRPGAFGPEAQPAEISFEPGRPMIDPTPRH